MNANLAHRLGNQPKQKNLMALIVDEAGYLILATITIVASAVATAWTEQFLSVAIIFGWKWICRSQTQVIQIYTTDQNDHSSN